MQIANTNAVDIAALMQPGLHHQTPQDVMNDTTLESAEKRAILASWASDIYAVESCPWLREVPGVRAALRLSDILAALRLLNDDTLAEDRSRRVQSGLLRLRRRG